MTHPEPDPVPDNVLADWSELDRWLVESLGRMSKAAVLDIGPIDVHVCAEHPAVDCAQIQALTSGTFLLRLSTQFMEPPLLSSYSVPREVLDVWHYDRAFSDCTHGYLLSRSRRRVAEIVIAWFRDRCGFSSPAGLGYSYTEAVRLPRSTHFPAIRRTVGS